MKKLRACSVTALLLGWVAGSAAASTIDFSFDAILDTGVGVGTTFTGTGSYDNAGLTGVGIEYAALTSFDFTVFGITSTLADVDGISQVTVDNGTLGYFTAGIIESASFSFVFGYDGPGSIADSLQFGHTFAPVAGTGTYEIVSSAVPEPSTLALCGMTLVVLLFLLKRGLANNMSGRSLVFPRLRLRSAIAAGNAIVHMIPARRSQRRVV